MTDVSFPAIGQGAPDGAEDGPGLTGLRGAEVGIGAGETINGDKGAVLGVDSAAASIGHLHSLNADDGVIGLRESGTISPPRARLDLNSCSCMMSDMFGPIHLDLFFTMS